MFKEIIEDIEFDNDFDFPKYKDPENPYDVKWFIENHDDLDTSKLQEALAEFEKLEPNVSQEEMKEVFLMLKNREIHPRGEFDKQGRFYLKDAELVDVRSPSVRYPYPQMNAGRTAKFVKDMAKKYKCQSKGELLSKFVE